MNNGLDLRQLRYFACLAEELHFGRAAERLGIAQAPLSQQIKLMEERLGVLLFHRTTRRTRLTSAGQTLLQHAHELLDGLDRAVAHTRAMADETAGRLVVAGVHMALSHVLPPILAEFQRVRPAVIVDVLPLGTAEQLRTLDTGEINVAFIRPTEQAAFMQVERLFSEGYVAALPLGHPLAARKSLRLKDFAGEWMIGYAPVLGTTYSTIVLEHLHRAGVYPRIVQKCTHTMSIIAHVGSGLGVAILPSWIANCGSPHVEFRPVPELPEAVELMLAWPSGDTRPIVMDFIDAARRGAAGLKVRGWNGKAIAAAR